MHTRARAHIPVCTRTSVLHLGFPLWAHHTHKYTLIRTRWDGMLEGLQAQACSPTSYCERSSRLSSIPMMMLPILLSSVRRSSVDCTEYPCILSCPLMLLPRQGGQGVWMCCCLAVVEPTTVLFPGCSGWLSRMHWGKVHVLRRLCPMSGLSSVPSMQQR